MRAQTGEGDDEGGEGAEGEPPEQSKKIRQKDLEGMETFRRGLARCSLGALEPLARGPLSYPGPNLRQSTLGSRRLNPQQKTIKN